MTTNTTTVEDKLMAPAATVLSVNVGSVREFEYNGRPARSAIWKSPAVGRIAARPDKALYAYAVEDARWWEQEIGQPLPTVSLARISRQKGLT